MRRKSGSSSPIEDLFSASSSPLIPHQLAGMNWPDPSRFPVNHAKGRVADTVWRDLLADGSALLVTGFASIAQIVEIVAARADGQGFTRVLLGTEPFATSRVSFGSPAAAFTQQVHDYWTEQRGVSLRLSAKIVQAIHAVESGALDVRFVPGGTRLHAKIYATGQAVTLGSSNFTDNGLRNQFEANARFSRENDSDRYTEAVRVAENYWAVGEDWNGPFIELLNRPAAVRVLAGGPGEGVCRAPGGPVGTEVPTRIHCAGAPVAVPGGRHCRGAVGGRERGQRVGGRRHRKRQDTHGRPPDARGSGSALGDRAESTATSAFWSVHLPSRISGGVRPWPAG